MFLNRNDLENFSRSKTRSRQLSQDRMICSVLGRYKMAVDMGDVTMSPHLIFDGFWESWITLAAIRSAVLSDAVAVVGANIGYYAVLFADLVGPNGHVHAFEPDERLADICQTNLIINGFKNRSTVHKMAVSSKSGRERFLKPPPTALGIGRLVDDAFADVDNSCVEVPCATLDEVLGDVRPNVVFTDAEGSDVKILAASPICRKSARSWFLEWFPGNDREGLDLAIVDGLKVHVVGFDGFSKQMQIPSTQTTIELKR